METASPGASSRATVRLMSSAISDDLDQLLPAARAWLADDPDPVTREELDQLVQNAEAGDRYALGDLADRFAGTLQFGTAGLRGAVPCCCR